MLYFCPSIEQKQAKSYHYPLVPIGPPKKHPTSIYRVCSWKGLRETSYYCKGCGVPLHFVPFKGTIIKSVVHNQKYILSETWLPALPTENLDTPSHCTECEGVCRSYFENRTSCFIIVAAAFSHLSPCRFWSSSGSDSAIVTVCPNF